MFTKLKAIFRDFQDFRTALRREGEASLAVRTFFLDSSMRKCANCGWYEHFSPAAIAESQKTGCSVQWCEEQLSRDKNV